MDFFQYQNQQLFAEDLSVADIAAQYGTPCYIYSRATIERHWQAFDKAAGKQPHLICYFATSQEQGRLLKPIPIWVSCR